MVDCTEERTERNQHVERTSPNRTDGDPSEDAYIDSIRKDLVRYRIDDESTKTENTEKNLKQAFKKKKQPPWFLIV